MTHALRRTTVAISLLFTATIARSAFPELPAFQDPPTDIRYPGKMIWADLFTEETTTCRTFYTELFGWTAETLGSGKDAYTLFRKDGRFVAGMIYRPAEKGSSTKGIWLPYFSVEDLNGTLETVRKNGGRIEVKAHAFPDRGEQAIVRDNQEALFGLMRTTDGDPDDYLAEYGEWIWAQLWVREPDQSLLFYEAVLGFTEMEGDPDDENIYDHLWATNGRYRASLDRIPIPTPTASRAGSGLSGSKTSRKPSPGCRNWEGSSIWNPTPKSRRDDWLSSGIRPEPLSSSWNTIPKWRIPHEDPLDPSRRRRPGISPDRAGMQFIRFIRFGYSSGSVYYSTGYGSPWYHGGYYGRPYPPPVYRPPPPRPPPRPTPRPMPR